jgi:glycosyltransferase involved in cell wall biosynthesis
MNLLFVTPFYKPAYIYGGPARSIPALAEGLVELGVEVTVYTTNANGKQDFVIAEHPADVDGVSVFYFNRDIPGTYFYSRQLGQACSNNLHRFDMIYVVSNWGYALLPACRAAQSMDKPCVISPRTSFMQVTWKGKHLKKWIYHNLMERPFINKSSAIHYTTRFEQSESAWLGLQPESFIVPNPVDMQEFKSLPVRGIFRNIYRILPDEKIILYLGRIEARKGLNVTLMAFARSMSAYSGVRLILAGPDEDNHSKELRDLASQLGITDQVLFTGYLNPPQRLNAYADADIFILTSRSENFGVAVVEAMACGLPVIVSDQVGLAEVIQQEKAGLVTPLDPNKISAALITLLQDSQLCQQIGRRGRRVAHEQFAPKAVARKMLEEFEGVLAVDKPRLKKQVREQ